MEQKIRIILETREDSFMEYRYIFDSLNRIDSLNNKFLTKNVNKRLSSYSNRSRVANINKGSIDIIAFVQENWVAIVLFVLSTKGHPISYIKETFKSFEEFIDSVENVIKDVTSDFPETEKYILENIYNWIIKLNQEELEKLSFQVNFVYYFLKRRLKKIQKSSNTKNLNTDNE